MYNGDRVVVGMPAYNEAAYVEEIVTSFLEQRHVDEVIVVNNNSTDNTADIAADAGAVVVTESNQGYGHACQRALGEANEYGDVLCLVEPDGTFVARDIEKLLAYVPEFDFVVGTRTASNLIWEEANMGPFLRWGNWFVAKLLEITHNTSSITDVGCTFRLIRSEAYEQICGRLTVGGSHFSPEMLVRVAQSDISMIEVPVNYRGRKGKSKITGDFLPALKLGFVMIGFIIQEWARSLR